MTTTIISATEFSRELSDFLSQVQYQNQVLDIERGKRVIARVSPVSSVDGFPLKQLDALLVNGPRLLAADVDDMAKDLQAARTNLLQRSDRNSHCS